MDPIQVKNNVIGMSQLAEFSIKTANEDSRVCSPTAQMIDAQATNSTSSNYGISFSGGLQYDLTKGKWAPSTNGNFSKSWGSAFSYSYKMSNVIFTQQNNNNHYATWSYDYISKNKDKSWNAYLMSSSKVAGNVVYRAPKIPTNTNRNDVAPTSVKYDIRFGAGSKSDGAVANRMGLSSNRDMCIKKGTITISY